MPANGNVIRFRGNAEGLTYLVAVIRDEAGSPVYQIDVFRTMRGGNVFCHTHSVDADMICHRISEETFDDLESAFSKISETWSGAVIDTTAIR